MFSITRPSHMGHERLVFEAPSCVLLVDHHAFEVEDLGSVVAEVAVEPGGVPRPAPL